MPPAAKKESNTRRGIREAKERAEAHANRIAESAAHVPAEPSPKAKKVRAAPTDELRTLIDTSVPGWHKMSDVEFRQAAGRLPNIKFLHSRLYRIYRSLT